MPRSAKIENVGLTYLVGEAPEAIRIAPDPERLALYGVTLQQLAGKVQSANRTFSTGKLRDSGEQIDLVAGETLTAPAEVANLLLTTRDARPVYVRDVATVEYVPDTSDQIVANVTRDAAGEVERAPAVTLAVAKRAGANAVVVAEEILHQAEELEGHLIPEGVEVQVTRDYGETANEKANELLFHLGLATVSIIALVLVRHRLARKHRGRDRHPRDHPADALRRMDHGLHAQPRFAVRADLSPSASWSMTPSS